MENNNKKVQYKHYVYDLHIYSSVSLPEVAHPRQLHYANIRQVVVQQHVTAKRRCLSAAL